MVKDGKRMSFVLASGLIRRLQTIPVGLRTRYIEDLIIDDVKKGPQARYLSYGAREKELASLSLGDESVVADTQETQKALSVVKTRAEFEELQRGQRLMR